MTLQLLHSEFPYWWGKFDFLFYQCNVFLYIAVEVVLPAGLPFDIYERSGKMLENEGFYVPANCEFVWPPGEFRNAFLDSREHIFLFACAPWGVITTCPGRYTVVIGK
jgi:hypothetical protein